MDPSDACSRPLSVAPPGLPPSLVSTLHFLVFLFLYFSMCARSGEVGKETGVWTDGFGRRRCRQDARWHCERCLSDRCSDHTVRRCCAEAKKRCKFQMGLPGPRSHNIPHEGTTTMMIMIIIIMPLLFRPAESLCRVKLSAGGRSARRRRVEETPKADTQPRPDHASHEIHGVPATEHRRHSSPDSVPHGEKKKINQRASDKKDKGAEFCDLWREARIQP